VLTGAGAEERRTALGLDATSAIVLVSTEGPAANPHFTADH
jgi:diaminopropionate ammonia-lyase